MLYNKYKAYKILELFYYDKKINIIKIAEKKYSSNIIKNSKSILSSKQLY